MGAPLPTWGLEEKQGKSSGCYAHWLGPREKKVSSTEVAVDFLSGLVADQLSGLPATPAPLAVGVVAPLSGIRASHIA